MTVPAGGTVAADLLALGDDVAYVEVRPDGVVHAAATYRSGDGVATVPLSAAPVDVRAPDARPAR